MLPFANKIEELQSEIEEWFHESARNGKWSANGISITEAWLKQGLLPRAITRDLKWGTPVPLDGYDVSSFLPLNAISTEISNRRKYFMFGSMLVLDTSVLLLHIRNSGRNGTYDHIIGYGTFHCIDGQSLHVRFVIKQHCFFYEREREQS
jgi:hypothetical protein